MIQCVYAGRNSFSNHSSFQWQKILQNGRKILSSYQQTLQRITNFAQISLGISQRAYSPQTSYSSQGWHERQQPDRKLGIYAKESSYFFGDEKKTDRENERAHGKKHEAKGNTLAQIKSWFKIPQKIKQNILVTQKKRTNNLPFLWRGIFYLLSIPNQVLFGYLQRQTTQIKNLKEIGYEPVYNLEVENTHCFSVEGGILVHNCYDAIREVFLEWGKPRGKGGGVRPPYPELRRKAPTILDGRVPALDIQKLIKKPKGRIWKYI